VDTRLRRLAEGGYDAIVLARAGLIRLERAEEGAALGELVPAPGQGCLVLEARSDDEAAREAAGELTDGDALAALTAERAVVTALEATCNTPIGAWARLDDGAPREGAPGAARREDGPPREGAPLREGGPLREGDPLRLTAFVGLPDGTHWIRDDFAGDASNPVALGREVARRLEAAGARELLAEAERAAGARL